MYLTFPMCLTRMWGEVLLQIILRVGCCLNGMLSDCITNSLEPYTANPSPAPRLFSWKLFLPLCKEEMSWLWQKRCVPTIIHFPQTPTLAQGSGKTLAYGLPVLHKLLSWRKRPASKIRRPVRALILAPTRELALQISSHLNACLNGVNAPEDRVTSNDPKVPKAPPLVSVAAIVGGMSPQKQKRILSRGVDVLVATPGRLWDIMQEVCNPRRSMRHF